mmetsp:Transcript_34946/g.75317  ORF Transcript_34946/g.75317 Transcript_34946/m.75317 type:complete len:424 (+) Transcript_34946:72-1343(+)
MAVVVEAETGLGRDMEQQHSDDQKPADAMPTESKSPESTTSTTSTSKALVTMPNGCGGEEVEEFETPGAASLRGAAVPHSPLASAMVEVDSTGRTMLFTFFGELSEPVQKLATTAWAARGKLAHDVKVYVVLVSSTVASMPGRVTKVLNDPRLHDLLQEEEDPQALAAVVCGGSGAVILGSAGAVVGTTTGGAAGLALGAVPAIFTFGLSLPIGAAIGGSVGLASGLVCGGSAGLAAGATSGMTVACFRDDISYVTLAAVSRVYDAYDLLVVRPVAAARSTTRSVCDRVNTTADYTKAKAKAASVRAKEVVSNPQVQVSAGSAAAGAAALGTAGGATGAMVGGATGILVGLVPALFTFGLSIPIGAVVGGGAGLAVGASAGAATGFVGGGAAGSLGYAYRGLPRSAVQKAGAVAADIKGRLLG